ncbi:hypothetical protein EJ05DRAFT_504878 [Pseudovirgaria hyperparasitica]|uniref:Poly(A) RNA polymerase mitochondrial-like central palm domain-containing protein n=1 Tax=Pseudovirgaria hyperparasitica TaxID=470096 RepID=A0A6A6VX11_9PEZI|nr:uncharacterized protein EJ05DRAFT_504878 [Pseudovirgaria hyperparasitica]KAF2753797.1 hypothetical protein EJ05DRAFT_504878 [Pseudovirgaria hyperparasitica]
MRPTVPRICVARNTFKCHDALLRIFFSSERCMSTTSRLDEPFGTLLRTHRSKPNPTDESKQEPIPGVTKEIVAANIRQLKDIHPKDLEATLEAHRASNAAYAERVASTPPVNVGTRSRDAGKRDLEQYNGKMMKNMNKRLNKQLDSRLKDKRQPSSGTDPEARKKPVTRPKESTLNIQRGASKATLSSSERRQMNDAEKLEYEGTVIQPMVDTVVEPEKLPWYIDESERRRLGLDGLKRLDLEIERFHAYVLPSPVHEAARAQVIADTRANIKRFVDGISSEVFGSVRTGLALATSDIDIRIRLNEAPRGAQGKTAPRFWIRKELGSSLKRFHDRIHGNIVSHRKRSISPPYMLVEYRHARYPLISMQHIKSGLDVQIVCANDSSVSRDYMATYLEMYPGLRRVYNVVKLAMDVRGLTDVFRGGLGSYSIFMMVAASFRLDGDAKSKTPAQNLLQFLDFWGNLDLYTWGVSLQPPALFKKSNSKPKKGNHKNSKPQASPDAHSGVDEILHGRTQIGRIDKNQPYLMCLQDPADPLNDLGYKSFGIKHIIATLRSIGEELKVQIRADSQGSLLEPAVGPAFPLHLSRRWKLEEYGREVMSQDAVPSIADVISNEPDVRPDKEARRAWAYAQKRAERHGKQLIAMKEANKADQNEHEQQVHAKRLEDSPVMATTPVESRDTSDEEAQGSTASPRAVQEDDVIRPEHS